MHGSGLTCKFVMGSWTAHVWGSEQLGKHSFPSISSQTPPGLTWFCKDLIDTSPGKATLPCLPVSVDHLRGCVLCAGLSTCAITLWTAYVSYKFFPRPITTPIKSVQSPPSSAAPRNVMEIQSLRLRSGNFILMASQIRSEHVHHASLLTPKVDWIRNWDCMVQT